MKSFIFKIYEAVMSFPFGDDVLDWIGPPHFLMKVLTKCAFMWPNSIKWDPSIDLSNSKVLFVANHAIWGLDLPLLVSAIYKKTGRLPRGLGDRSHFYWPVIRQTLQYFGVVLGCREVCARLMEAGQPILVFPGGGREVMKKKSDGPYPLCWGEKKGFAELAVAHGYTIVPVASVGAEECVHIVTDVSVAPILGLIGDKRAKEGFTVPLLLPKSLPQRFYLSFGQPILTTGRHDNNSPGYEQQQHQQQQQLAQEALRGQENAPPSNTNSTDREQREIRRSGDCFSSLSLKIRDDTRRAVQSQINELRTVQGQDPDRYLLQSLGNYLLRFVTVRL